MTTNFIVAITMKKMVKNEDFNLLIIDIDHLKKINDSYGHEVGDDVIRHVAQRISNSIRNAKDVAVRWGGEEFIITFADMTSSQLHIKAKQICHSIASAPILNLSITVSIGGISAD
ncbi:GGDEF domain-containing protein [Photobacterium kishitanii]|uniref:GGDEF domain-containing protein n=1 Tax=Photobacterium kishitanii TaxID=318456 RepID=UPI00273A4265|nr:GGDEF domain-containing protein [Photobacterium kishitanii]